jgi:hypothetical protein
MTLWTTRTSARLRLNDFSFTKVHAYLRRSHSLFSHPFRPLEVGIFVRLCRH